MADLIDSVRRNDGIRIGRFILFELGIDAREPFVENFGWARIERRKRPYNTGFTLGDYQFGARYKEQRRSDDGHAKIVL